MKFKVGDRIKLVSWTDEGDYYGNCIGEMGTIIDIFDKQATVNWDNDIPSITPWLKNIMKFEVGDRIQLVSMIDEADYYERYIGEKGTVRDVCFSHVLVDWDNDTSYFIAPLFKNIKKLEDNMITSLDQLEPGKIYIDDDGCEFTFIGLINSKAVISNQHHDDINSYTYSLEKIQEEEWKLKTEPKKMTMAELNKKLGYEVEIVE